MKTNAGNEVDIFKTLIINRSCNKLDVVVKKIYLRYLLKSILVLLEITNDTIKF